MKDEYVVVTCGQSNSYGAGPRKSLRERFVAWFVHRYAPDPAFVVFGSNLTVEYFRRTHTVIVEQRDRESANRETEDWILATSRWLGRPADPLFTVGEIERRNVAEVRKRDRTTPRPSANDEIGAGATGFALGAGLVSIDPGSDYTSDDSDRDGGGTDGD